MKKVQVVTTFSDENYNLYANNFIKSYLKYWPKDYLLITYVDKLYYFTSNGRIKENIFLNVSEDLVSFKNNFKDIRFKGVINNVYNFKYDAIKFCHKVFAILHAFKYNKSDILIWLDADIVTLKDIPLDLITSLIDGNKGISWFNRENNYPECGFLIFNLNCLNTHIFFNELRNTYISGDIFNFNEWHDSYIIQQLALKIFDNDQINNLSGSFSKVSHPIINVLGEYIDHLKGVKRKELGHSFKTDYKGSIYE